MALLAEHQDEHNSSESSDGSGLLNGRFPQVVATHQGLDSNHPTRKSRVETFQTNEGRRKETEREGKEIRGSSIVSQDDHRKTSSA